MAGGLERRTPRGVREAKAYRAVQVGTVTAVGFAVTTVLWIAGVMNDHPAVVLLIATILCAVRFAQMTGMTNRRS